MTDDQELGSSPVPALIGASDVLIRDLAQPNGPWTRIGSVVDLQITVVDSVSTSFAELGRRITAAFRPMTEALEHFHVHWDVARAAERPVDRTRRLRIDRALAIRDRRQFRRNRRAIYGR